MNIPRLALIQSLISKNGYNNYLEIGVSIGTVFFRINCRNKYAVDPSFGFSKMKILTRSVRLNNYSNLRAKYFEKTSDDFFKMDAGKVLNEKLGICLVDGMHEYSYALNDIQNTLDYLSDDGVIVVHDCNPRTTENACTYTEWEQRGFTGEWNGDVWKAIVYLRSTRADINIFTAATDQGLGIITKKSEPDKKMLLFKDFNQVKQLKFSDLDKNRQEWLNLKPASYLNEYFGINIPLE